MLGFFLSWSGDSAGILHVSDYLWLVTSFTPSIRHAEFVTSSLHIMLLVSMFPLAHLVVVHITLYFHTLETWLTKLFSCRELRRDGQSCDDGTECPSGQCVSGVCAASPPPPLSPSPPPTIITSPPPPTPPPSDTTGSTCTDGTECSSGSCKGGNCCSTKGDTRGCAACSETSGDCTRCYDHDGSTIDPYYSLTDGECVDVPPPPPSTSSYSPPPSSSSPDVCSSACAGTTDKCTVTCPYCRASERPAPPRDCRLLTLLKFA